MTDMPKPSRIVITDDDFKGLIKLVNSEYDSRANEYNKRINIDAGAFIKSLKNLNQQERYAKFAKLVDDYPRAWEFDGYHENRSLSKEANNAEFLRRANAVLPVEIRNSGDPEVIENYILKNKKLNIKGKARLVKRLSIIERKEHNLQEAAKRADGNEPYARPALKVGKNGAKSLAEN